MGLLFQPRWCGNRVVDRAVEHDHGVMDRPRTFLAALEAVVLGDAHRFATLFTEDVVFRSPHVASESLASLRVAVGSPEDSLSDVTIVVVVLDDLIEKVIGEWRVEARFTRPVLFDDRLLIEPTGGPVRLPGASVAEFRGDRIKAFRHYFDDTELLAAVPGAPSYLRWSPDH
jgi:ketosteroid isomerase-like protein